MPTTLGASWRRRPGRQLVVDEVLDAVELVDEPFEAVDEPVDESDDPVSEDEPLEDELLDEPDVDEPLAARESVR